jgi:hypothetical protein
VRIFFSYCVFLKFLLSALVYGQTPPELKMDESRFYKKSRVTDPSVLIENITKDKHTDEEKFKAIFKWVTENIDYDYDLYFSTGIVKRHDVKRLLRSGKAICIDYAFLMDTLCYMAGITNATIYGYAKDELFDVTDSLYIDNHAWNAVKLNNLWYVYDVTWSTGSPYYRYTRFSQFIVNLKKRFTVKYVAKTLRLKRKWYYKKSICGFYVASSQGEKKIRIYEPVYRHKILRKILNLFRLKIIRSYKKELNNQYYLSNPELFAIDHFPDDPDWSLLSRKTIRDFECDSSFYHLNDSTYASQNKQGRTCPDCDNDLRLDILNKEFHLRKQSLEFNPRNRFVTSLCEYNIGCLKFEESKKYEDSLTKITLLDTSLAFFQYSKNSLMQAAKNLSVNQYLQTTKNRKKLDHLLDDNRNHSEFIKTKMKLSFQETKNIRDLEGRMEVDLRKFYFRSRLIENYKSGDEIAHDAKKVQLTIDLLYAELATKKEEIDSLNGLIGQLRGDFDQLIPSLNDHLWKKVYNHDSLIIPIKKTIQHRISLLDDSKKKIVELRKDMIVFEKNYANEVDSTLYKPADFCYRTGKLISQLVEQRNKLNSEYYRVVSQLVKFGENSPTQLDALKKNLKEENENDLCWIVANAQGLQSVFCGFKALLVQQKTVEFLLTNENRLEAQRCMIVNIELKQRKKKYQHIITNNRKVVNIKNREVKRSKSDYLKLLRKERREARINH